MNYKGINKMKVLIKRCYPKKNINVLVRSDYGDFIVEWHGNQPQVGKYYEIELGIDEKITDYKFSDCRDDKILNFNGLKIRINAVIESQDRDGVAYLRIGNDLLLLDLEEFSLVGKRIQIEIKKIKAYPIN